MKEKFLTANNTMSSTSSIKSLTRLLTFKSIIMISVISAIVITIAITTSYPKENNPIEKEQVPLASMKLTDSILIVEEQEKIIEEYRVEVESEIDSEELIFLPKIEPSTIESKVVERASQLEFKKIKEQYRFPKLTAKEIVENNKQKSKMLKQLAKFNKKKYAYIPSGSFEIEEKKISVQAIYMQTTEITNLEYRTFLFDLLIQNRKEDFLIANPKQQMWIEEYPNSFNKPMEKNYFSHPAYNDYPVVAISREGAELYCFWITQETNKVFGKKYGYINDARIPTEYEWVHAAFGDHEKSIYPWNEITTQNEDSCYLANYNPGNGNLQSDGAFHTARVSSYNPNAFGLYCMSGNVAEMIYYHDEDHTPGTKGGSWTSSAEELKIEGPDPYFNIITPSVNIGFRVVITFLNN